MTRLVSAMKMDVTVQVRSNLYAIGIGVGVILAAALIWLADPNHLFSIIPTLMLLVVGGSTMLYVAAMIIFEKDEGTLNAVIVSPLRTSEYLWSKIITLTALATIESVVMFGGAMVFMYWFDELILPNVLLLLIGIMSIGVIYTLIGIILIVRFDKITDFIIPLSAVAMVLQAPALYFLGAITHPIFLVIPTSAPTMIMQGAYMQLTPWQWFYAVGFTTALVVGLTFWSYYAFKKHVIRKVG